MKKEFKIEATEKNTNWVKTNLDDRDYSISNNEIKIFYRHEFQKNDILAALK